MKHIFFLYSIYPVCISVIKRYYILWIYGIDLCFLFNIAAFINSKFQIYS